MFTQSMLGGTHVGADAEQWLGRALSRGGEREARRAAVELTPMLYVTGRGGQWWREDRRR